MLDDILTRKLWDMQSQYILLFCMSFRSAVQSMGAESFEKVYNYLKTARQNNTSEKEVKRHLETLVYRASECFLVDQILYFEEELSAASSRQVKSP